MAAQETTTVFFWYDQMFSQYSLQDLLLSVCYYGRPRFDPWVGKIPWRRKWQSTPGLLPGKSHGQRSLVGYSPRGRKESDTTERLHFTSFQYAATFRALYQFSSLLSTYCILGLCQFMTITYIFWYLGSSYLIDAK